MDAKTRIQASTEDPGIVAIRRIHEAGQQVWAPANVEAETRQFPCSPGQRRLWLLHELDPRNPSLNIAVRWRLEGMISNADLENAFRSIMLRHQVLRTYFADVAGEVMQVVEPHVSFHIPIIDLSDLSEQDALAEVERTANLEACTPFELSAPPLIRVTHLRLGEGASVLLVTLHHIVGDAWSIGILARELSEICAASYDERAVDLPVASISYGHFSASWSEQRSNPHQRTDGEFWERTLTGLKHFQLQPDRTRPPVLTANTCILSTQLDRPLTDGLAVLGQQNSATLHMVAMAVLFALLHRYSGETDISIGTEVVGRGEGDLDKLIGLFSLTLIMRNDLADNPSFAELLARVRNDYTEILKHQNITPEKLIEIVKSERDLSRNPLFSVSVMAPRPYAEDVNRKRIELIEWPPCFAGEPCDLHFSWAESAAGWTIFCKFNADLFEGQTIARLLDHYKTLLQAVLTEEVGGTIANLPMLGEAERRMLAVDSNRTGAIYPKHLTLPLLFETQAKGTPEAVAMICGEGSMSYRALDIASNRLAHELRRRGVTSGSRVAIFLDRSAELIVALLAVLKSGSAYIPLDPTYPRERLQYVLENARPAAVITREALRERLVHETLVVLVDAHSAVIAAQSEEPLLPTALPTDTAYVIYTSGSTGRPKGVAIDHRAVINLLCAMRSKPGLTAQDIMVAVTTISFDIAVLEVFLPLIVGARLILAQEREVADGAALRWLLRRHSATVMQATPVMWQLLLEAGWQGDPPLKMLCGGEAMPRKLAERLLDCGGELWNMYGPTETTVWSSVLRVESGDGPVPIGPPIANTQFYILDNRQALVPRGVAGELCIGGDGVAVGYFELPEVTAERFIPDKFRDVPGAKLYRTGDIVRMRDGERMEYLGRTDHQVKLRGFRIELGEIEAVLMRYPGIEEAVAMLGQDTSGESAIWAYVVAPQTTGIQADALSGALRASVAQFLPSFMCPSAIVVLESLPRTPNGKVDRRLLPAPAPVRHQGKPPVHPLKEMERRLSNIWRSVLGVEAVDTKADFFKLGGHSLLAARLLARIEAEFGQRLSLLTLFKAPNIEEQAKRLMHGGQEEYDFRQVVRLQPNGSKSPLIAIHNTGFYYYNLSKRLGPNQPLTALQVFDPSIARERLPESFEEIAAEYVRLIYKFQAAPPYKLIGWCVGGTLAFEVARQLEDAGHEVSLLAMIDAWAPGHNRRLSRPRAILADYSYRVQLISAGWRRVMSGEQSLQTFLKQRIVFKRVLRWFGSSLGKPQAHVAFEARELSAENYDQWLFGYLEQMEQAYEPKPYSGKITLLCSAREPKGLFLDPKMGWSAFAAGGIDVAVIEGDHFTMFNGQGLAQMALQIAG